MNLLPGEQEVLCGVTWKSHESPLRTGRTEYQIRGRIWWTRRFINSQVSIVFYIS